MLAKRRKYAESRFTLRFVRCGPLVLFASLPHVAVFLGQEPASSDFAYIGFCVSRNLPYPGNSGCAKGSLDWPHLFSPALNPFGGVSR